MLLWVISVVILVPVVAYWVNRKSERSHHKQRLQAIQARLREIEEEKARAGKRA